MIDGIKFRVWWKVAQQPQVTVKSYAFVKIGQSIYLKLTLYKVREGEGQGMHSKQSKASYRISYMIDKQASSPTIVGSCDLDRLSLDIGRTVRGVGIGGRSSSGPVGFLGSVLPGVRSFSVSVT